MALKFGNYLLLAALLTLGAGKGARAEWQAAATLWHTPLVSSLVVGVREPAPAPMPAKQIFFIPQAVFEGARGDGGGADIYAMNLDGSVQLRLTDYEDDDMQPSLSQDGSKVVFVRKFNNDYAICIMNSDGTDQRRLTSGSHVDYSPAISPDKNKVVFQRDFNEIYIINADGSNIRRLTFNNYYDEWPSFSSDGTKILFNSDRPGRQEIYTMGLDGSHVIRVTNTPGENFCAKFSPDGQKIVFTSDRDVVNNDHNSNIYIMRPDGTGQTRIVSNIKTDWSPRYSRDGSRIYFQSDRDWQPYAYWQIYSMLPNGFFLARITDPETQGMNGFY